MRSRLADLRRRCRRVGSVLVLAVIALLSMSGRRELPRERAMPLLPVLATLRAPEAPSLPEAPRRGLTARVIADGAPVVDAEVVVRDGSGPASATARTDADGVARFTELAAGPHELWATRAGLTAPLVRVAEVGAAPALELVLVPAGRVRGKTSVDGPLPAGSSVELVPLDIDHVVRVAALDERGELALDGVPYGHWRVESRVPGFVQPEEQIVHVTEHEAPLVLRLVPAGVVSGTVIDEAGAPIANATIVLRDQAHSAMPRPLILAPAGVRWVHPLAGTRLLPVIESSRFGAARPGARPTECGRGHCGVDLGHERGKVIHAIADGIVASVFAEDRTEAGRVVAIYHRGGLKSFYMHLDEIRDGLDVGQRIRAGEPIGTTGLTGIKHSAPHLHFAIVQERQGRTWYLDPEPVLRQAVVLAEPRSLEAVDPSVALAAAASPQDLDGASATVQRVTTDAHGVFRVEGVAPGAYVAVAFAPEFPAAASAPFRVDSAAQATGVVVTLHPGVTVHGRVVGRDGPLAGATVFASAGFGETAHKVATTATNRDGEFAMRSLDGKVTLTVTAPRHAQADRTLVIDEAERTRARYREDFTLLIADAQLRGQVLAPEGGAAAGVAVRVVEGPARRRAMTDAQGQFLLDKMPSGRYVLELSPPAHPSKRVTLQSDRWAEVRLEEGGAASALVRDAGGDPLVGARIELSGPDGQRALRATDASGRAELRGLAVGAWRLTVRATGYVPETQAVSIRDDRTPASVSFRLARAATVAGVVRDRFGRRIAGARVSLGVASTLSDADGNFRLAGVASGVLEAEHEGMRGKLDVELAPGEERVTLTIELFE